MKTKILIPLCCVFLLSCSSRKVHSEKLDYTSEIKQVTTKEQDGVAIGSTELNYKFDNRKNTFTPIDNTKPMVLDGKEYNNVIIHSDNTTGNGKLNTRDSTAFNSKERVELSKDEKAVLKVKEVEKKGESFLLKYISFTAFLIFLIYLFIFIKNRIKQKNPLQ